MAIKPILFNTEMIRAILDGRKTVTRRLVKPQPKSKLCYTFAGSDCGTWGYPSKTAHESWGEEYRLPDNITKEDFEKRWNPPYHADDVLYVRETWSPIYPDKESNEVCGYIYKEDSLEEYDNRYPDGEDYQWGGKWRPSIHMPKEAARIWLKVTDVRVERLQEITVDGCHREGINIETSAVTDGETLNRNHDFSLEKFETIWDSTVKKSDLDSYGWDANPYVWVIEFERCEKPEGV